MSKFVISGDTDTGELTASLDGNPLANVSYLCACIYETYEGDKKCAVSMESREKVGDATKVTTLYASKDSKKEIAKAELEDAILLNCEELKTETETSANFKRVGESILEQMNLNFGKK